MKAQLPAQRSLNPAIPLVWLGLAVWGTLAMMSESNRPGPSGSPPAKWPSGSKLSCPSQKPSLIMFVHPNCLCSKASLGELSMLVTNCLGRVNTHVLFLGPQGRPGIWKESDFWRDASAIPGVSVTSDQDGREARLFGAETSGEVVLYGVDGRLKFQGGLTISRGRLGDNPGRDALQALIDRKPSRVTQTPVFGCRLFGSEMASKK